MGVRGPAGPGLGDHEAQTQTIMHVRQATSLTRPDSPIAGQVIFETDTNRFLVWDGTIWNPRWVEFTRPRVAELNMDSFAGEDSPISISSSATTATVVTYPSVSFNSGLVIIDNQEIQTPVSGIYLAAAMAVWDSNTSGHRSLTIQHLDAEGSPVTTRLARDDRLPVAAAQSTGQTVSKFVAMEPDHRVRVVVKQDSGVALNMNQASLGLFFLAPLINS